MNISDELISLVKKALRSEQTDKEYSPEEVKSILNLAEKHEIANIVSGILWETNRFDGQSGQGERLIYHQMLALYRRETLDGACRQVSKEFSANKIQHVFLKGSVLKELYPQSTMRISSDIDILVHGEDFERAENVLKSMDFSEGEKSIHEHEFIARKTNLHIELHSILLSAKIFPKAADVLKNAWEYTTFGDDEFSGRFSDELTYFYHVAHTAKHFRNGGCGIRAIIDLYLLNNMQGVDADKRKKLIAEGCLEEFDTKVNELAEYWFGEKSEADTFLKQMADYIIAGGVHGRKNVSIAKSVMAGSKTKYTCAAVFSPFSEMKRMYPILEKHPVLLPACHVVRFIRIIGKGNRSVRKLKFLCGIDNKSVQMLGEMFKELNIL